MKVAQYLPGGRIEVSDAPEPDLPDGGLLVATEACGLCSGELMPWYMEAKAPHVLGHEVAGRVVASDHPSFPRGSRVAPHHHAACMGCEECRAGRHVFCRQWKDTRLVPGGMASTFAVPAANLSDTYLVDDLAATDAALVEPLACVAKSIRRAGPQAGERIAVVGLGVMGLMHLLLLRERDAVGYELKSDRRAWAAQWGLEARHPAQAKPADVVILCPGVEPALRFALDLAAPNARVLIFAPMPPDKAIALDLGELYFRDLTLINSYSAGPPDMAQALAWLRAGTVGAEQVVSHFVALEELPEAYGAMQSGQILKPMVVFP